MLDDASAFCDEQVVVDKGSTDNTDEVATAHGVVVQSFEWIDDFSAARNFPLTNVTASGSCGWTLMNQNLRWPKQGSMRSGRTSRITMGPLRERVTGIEPA